MRVWHHAILERVMYSEVRRIELWGEICELGYVSLTRLLVPESSPWCQRTGTPSSHVPCHQKLVVPPDCYWWKPPTLPSGAHASCDALCRQRALLIAPESMCLTRMTTHLFGHVEVLEVVRNQGYMSLKMFFVCLFVCFALLTIIKATPTDTLFHIQNRVVCYAVVHKCIWLNLFFWWIFGLTWSKETCWHLAGILLRSARRRWTRHESEMSMVRLTSFGPLDVEHGTACSANNRSSW